MEPPRFWLVSDAPEPRFDETLDPLEKKSKLLVYPFDRCRKGVDGWPFFALLCWFRHYEDPKPRSTPTLAKIPPGSPEMGVLSYK